MHEDNTDFLGNAQFGEKMMITKQCGIHGEDNADGKINEMAGRKQEKEGEQSNKR